MPGMIIDDFFLPAAGIASSITMKASHQGELPGQLNTGFSVSWN